MTFGLGTEKGSWNSTVQAIYLQCNCRFKCTIINDVSIRRVYYFVDYIDLTKKTNNIFCTQFAETMCSQHKTSQKSFLV